MPLGFFSTLAAWIGIGVVEHSQRTRADRVARENPFFIMYCENKEASKLREIDLKKLREIYLAECEEMAPIDKVIIEEYGEFDFYPREETRQYMCYIYGILQKRGIPGKGIHVFRCERCKGKQRCLWHYNICLPTFTEYIKRYPNAKVIWK